jgi:glycosyltransferase involved in cell wall biosynthesis
VAEYYPRRRDPVLGIWAHRQALAARAAGAEVRVVALERPVPPVAALRPLLRGDPSPLARELRALGSQPRQEVRDGIEVEYVRFAAPPRERSYGGWHRWAAAPLARALERLHRQWPFDLVHAHYALPSGGAARPFAARRGVPLVVSVHGGDVLSRVLGSPAARAEVGATLRGATAVLCNSRATLGHAAALAGSDERMRVVHLGAEPPANPLPKRREPTVATLAHVIPRKRHTDVLNALPPAAKRIPELRWAVIGDGPELPALRAEASRLGVEDRVDWLGELEPARALEELAACHLMAMPSIDEAFGVAYVEALACGLPAIGRRGEGGPEEIAALGEGMVLVPPREPRALADAIESTLTMLDGLSVAARETARRHFSWEACGRATLAAYEDAVTGRA